MLLIANITTVQAASDDSEPPTEMQIESFLRKALANEDSRVPPAYWSATLMDFELQKLEWITPSRWVVETELQFDFGPPPPTVLGFERLRRGRYRLILYRESGQLQLKRFSPMDGIRLLPRV